MFCQDAFRRHPPHPTPESLKKMLELDTIRTTDRASLARGRSAADAVVDRIRPIMAAVVPEIPNRPTSA